MGFDLKSSNRTCPSTEIRSLLKLCPLLPQDNVGFLQDIFNATRPWHQGDDIRPELRLKTRYLADEYGFTDVDGSLPDGSPPPPRRPK